MSQPTNVPTPAEIQESTTRMVDKLFGPDPNAPKPAAAPAQPAAAQPPSPPPVAAQPQPPVPARPAAPPPREEHVSLETIDRTARIAAETVADRLRPTSQPESDFELNKDDAADLEALRYLAQQEPDKYGQLPQQYLEFLKKSYIYMDAWQEKNQGEEFNWDDADHVKWYDTNAPKGLDPEAIKEAKAEMRAMARVENKMKPILQEQALERAMPHISYKVHSMIVAMVDGINPELGACLRNAAGHPDLTMAAQERLEAKDPLAAEFIVEEVLQLIPILAELEKTLVHGLEYDFELAAKKNPNLRGVHNLIKRISNQTEDEILSGPREDQMFDGKQFTRIDDMRAMRRQIANGPGSEESKIRKIEELYETRTILSGSDLQTVILDAAADRTRQKINRLDGIAKKKYGQNTPQIPQPGPTPPQPARQEPAKVEPQPAPDTNTMGVRFQRPPSFSTQSDMVTPGKVDAPKTETKGDRIANVLFK